VLRPLGGEKGIEIESAHVFSLKPSSGPLFAYCIRGPGASESGGKPPLTARVKC
jgi:hypothetical protein